MNKSQSQEFVTFRRYYMDQVLCDLTFKGAILDVGGKKKKKRGSHQSDQEAYQLNLMRCEMSILKKQ